MKDLFRDKTRDKLAQNLNSLGVTAVLSERNRVEEKVENSWYQRSLGIIDITGGLIRWINILKKDGSKNSPPRWWVILGIPDERPVPDHKKVDIRTVRKKSFPIFGKVVEVTWKGNDYGTGLVETLSRDDSITNLVKNIGHVTIHSYTKEFQGWTLQVDRRITLTHHDWAAVQKTAKYIHATARIL